MNGDSFFTPSITPATWLFVPAMRIDRVPKAFASGADQVIVDLEDAVADSDKIEARAHLKEYCQQEEARAVWVRINKAGSKDFAEDVALCAYLPNVSGVVLAKAERAADIEHAYQRTKRPVIALIESALGLTHLDDMAKTTGLYAFSYGFLDICQNLRVQVGTPAADMLANQIRYQLLIHSAANQLIAPIDSIYPNFQDDAGLTARVQLWSQMGLSGMLCIHPKQVDVVKKALMPTDSDIDFAKRVLDEYERCGQAVFSLDNQMIDTPVIARARQLLGDRAP